MAEVGDDSDFFGNASMMNLIAKMGDLDKELEEIAKVDKPNKDKSNNYYDGVPDFNDSTVSDVVLDGDDDEGMEALQRELKAFEALAEQVEQAKKQQQNGHPLATATRTVSVTVYKQTPKSPVGISMKTSASRGGITLIVNIAETGLLRGSALKPGAKLVEINGVAIQNAKHARYLIERAEFKVTIVAELLE